MTRPILEDAPKHRKKVGKKPYAVEHRFVRPAHRQGPSQLDWLYEWRGRQRYSTLADAERAVRDMNKNHPGIEYRLAGESQ